MNDLSGLGRLRSIPDPRNEKFRVPRGVVSAAAGAVRRHWWTPILDQGPKPQCVAFSGKTVLMGNPFRQGVGLSEQEIYDWCQRNDYWPGEGYDGTSVHALMKWMLANGFIERYEWAKTAEEVVAHILTRGPALLGTEWTVDMFQMDRWGYIRPTGSSVGGHAYCLSGADRVRVDPYTKAVGAVRKAGSWGRRWAQRGRAWMNLKDLQQLIDDHGEAALPVEKRA